MMENETNNEWTPIAGLFLAGAIFGFFLALMLKAAGVL